MDLLGRQVERRVDPDPVAIGRRATLEVHEAGLVLRAGDREDRALERLAIAPEARDRVVLHGGTDVRPEPLQIGRRPVVVLGRGRARQLPVLGRRGLEMPEHVEHPFDRLAHRDLAVGGRLAEVRPELVEVPPDAPPALDHRPAVLRGLDRLVVDEVLEDDGRTAQGIDRPLVRPRPDRGRLARRLVDQHLAGHALHRRQAVDRDGAVRPGPARRATRGAAPWRPASHPRAGHRTGDRRRPSPTWERRRDTPSQNRSASARRVSPGDVTARC